jgi:uncharacterized damage-inducible protein DinB
MGNPGEANPTLAVLTSGWEAYQERLIAALAPLTDEQLALRAAPHLRSIGENVRHIISTRAGWFSSALGIGDEEFAAFHGWQAPDAPARSAAELVRGLAETWRVMRGALAGFTPAEMQEVVRGERKGRPFELVRGWIVWHVIEHDLHHGGEVSFTLGMHGLAAPDI